MSDTHIHISHARRDNSYSGCDAGVMSRDPARWHYKASNHSFMNTNRLHASKELADEDSLCCWRT